MSSDKETIEKYAKSGDVNESNDDSKFKLKAFTSQFGIEHGVSMTSHSNEYTKLLESYIKNSESTFEQKIKFKQTFFNLSIIILAVSFSFFIILSICFLYRADGSLSIKELSGLLSSVIGLLSLYIIIPKIIAKYLFNIQEDTNMTKIIRSIQEYDEKVFRSISGNEVNQDKIFLEANKAMQNIKSKLEEEESEKEPLEKEIK